MKLTFNACKHLDFESDYSATKEVLANGKVFWLRDVSYDPTLPSMVQFCELRGRLNDPEDCLCESKKRCNDYIEHEHHVEVEVHDKSINYVGVKFDSSSKIYHYKTLEQLEVGDKVVVHARDQLLVVDVAEINCNIAPVNHFAYKWTVCKVSFEKHELGKEVDVHFRKIAINEVKAKQ